MNFLINILLGCNCISDTDFKSLCHQEVVLKHVLSALNEFRGDSLGNFDNNLLRFAGYNQYIWWMHNYLGKRNKKVTPS